MKLNELLSNKVVAFGFGAFKEYAQLGLTEGSEVVISTLSPAVMNDMGISSYYAPVLPRNTVFNTAQEVFNADLDVQYVQVFKYCPWDTDKDNITIVSRHQGTVDLLKAMYPNAKVQTGNVAEDNLNGKHVIGTLPPALIQHCKSYRAVSVKDFDYAKDGDLTGQDLFDRIVICDPIVICIK